ncbi:MAG TPA: hypothetical protein VK659_31200 [Asanoa sp.]|nr:hypothetical protein [Asanoa sp.]
MAENGVRPPERPSNDHQRDGQPNGHREAPIARQDDVYLDIPKLNIDKIEIDVANLRARVSLNAEVLSLLRLNVGVDAMVDQVHLAVQGVEAEAQLRVRLENVAHIVDRVLGTLDNHPEIIQPLVENAGKAVGAAGRGIESAVTDTGQGAGEAVRELGGGASDATRDVGRGAGEATREVGGGAGQATRSVGEGAGDATRQVGAGAREATGDVGEATQGVVGDTARDANAGDVAKTAGQAGKQVTEHAAAADLGDADQPDISAQSTVAADQEEKRPARQPRRAGLPRRKPRQW